jgi:hypothetical protein|tara:strand:- start:4924 stop:5427 length:504 start_codon:yes stop_codon:yes gene_type:complete
MISTKEIQGKFKFGRLRNSYDPIDRYFANKINCLAVLDSTTTDTVNWISTMAFFGSRGERLESLEHKLPLPIGESIESVMQDKQFLAIVHTYIMGYSSHTSECYNDYRKNNDMLGANPDMTKPMVDAKKEIWKENSKYLKEIKETYLPKKKAKKTRADILESDDDDI